MKNTKFWVWFYGCNIEIHASCVQNAMILAQAQRINDGLSICVTFIEDENENMWKSPSLLLCAELVENK